MCKVLGKVSPVTDFFIFWRCECFARIQGSGSVGGAGSFLDFSHRVRAGLISPQQWFPGKENVGPFFELYKYFRVRRVPLALTGDFVPFLHLETFPLSPH